MDYRFATLDEVTAGAVLVCPGANDHDRVKFRYWVYEALKHIGPTGHWVKNCKLTPKNRSFKKPDDLASTVSVALYDSSNSELQFEYFHEGAGRVHADRQYTHQIGSQQTTYFRPTLSEDAYYFHLDSNSNDVAYMMLRYYAMPIDANKQLLVPEDSMLACQMFCRFMWSLAKGDNQSEIELSRDTWFRERDRVYGNNKMPSVFQAHQFAKKYLSLLNQYKPERF